MLTDLQHAKLANRFQWLDADGDGQIQKNDIDLLVDRICKKFVPEDKSAEEAEIRAGYGQLWQQLIENCDADTDGRISKEEYLKAVESGILDNPLHYEESLGRALSALFKSLDSNGDGRIDRDEFLPLGSTFGLTPEMVAMVFTKLDTDGDGEITLQEWEAAVRDFYLGDSPDTAGGSLFGKAPPDA